jgi:hypothetical protein
MSERGGFFEKIVFNSGQINANTRKYIRKTTLGCMIPGPQDY